MSTDRDSVIEPWLRRQLVVFGAAMAVSLVPVRVIWQTILEGIYGTMDVSTWVVLSVLLSLVTIFYVKTDAM